MSRWLARAILGLALVCAAASEGRAIAFMGANPPEDSPSLFEGMAATHASRFRHLDGSVSTDMRVGGEAGLLSDRGAVHRHHVRAYRCGRFRAGPALRHQTAASFASTPARLAQAPRLSPNVRGGDPPALFGPHRAPRGGIDFAGNPFPPGGSHLTPLDGGNPPIGGSQGCGPSAPAGSCGPPGYEGDEDGQPGTGGTEPVIIAEPPMLPGLLAIGAALLCLFPRYGRRGAADRQA